MAARPTTPPGDLAAGLGAKTGGVIGALVRSVYLRRRCEIAVAAMLAGLAACGDGVPLGSQDPTNLHAEVQIETAPAGLEAAVVIDSVSWEPAVLLPTVDETVLEVEGPYQLDVRNTSAQALEMRYDLRFYDDSDLFVDNHIPFGLPLLLRPGATRREAGRFVIRTPARTGRFGLRLMRVAVRLSLPDSATASGRR